MPHKEKGSDKNGKGCTGKNLHFNVPVGIALDKSEQYERPHNPSGRRRTTCNSRRPENNILREKKLCLDSVNNCPLEDVAPGIVEPLKLSGLLLEEDRSSPVRGDGCFSSAGTPNPILNEVGSLPACQIGGGDVASTLSVLPPLILQASRRLVEKRFGIQSTSICRVMFMLLLGSALHLLISLPVSSASTSVSLRRRRTNDAVAFEVKQKTTFGRKGGSRQTLTAVNFPSVKQARAAVWSEDISSLLFFCCCCKSPGPGGSDKAEMVAPAGRRTADAALAGLG
ncbi:hypothetical protein EYF80_011807 [Liparis tanakae]|uniref:Uncharacterized protein n=1 Tax=Liparis tanakae TaxID=230148 RepID=A0A4Z2ILK6_9TELE|nr:hypothetical protein EYF80_011807 [Liparis tanakae]